MITENDKIESGILKFQSFAKPPLVAGDYTLNSDIVLKEADDGKDKKYSNNSLNFKVSAPRLSLDPSLIYSVYPLPGSTAAYQTSLPHIVFTRKTLPWERTIDSANNPNPWLALLLLTTEEIKDNNVLIKEIPANQLTDKGAGNQVIPPAITLESRENNSNKIKVLELSLGLYKSISPKASELSYLAHTRQVDTSDKEDTGNNEKGWFATVVGNRLPQAEKDNTVFLVSLEGHPEAHKQGKGTTIRLVILNQWSFRSEGATFSQYAEVLIKNVNPLRIDTSGLKKKESAKPLNKVAEKALNYGYMPIPHELRNGKKTSSWYRGPLVPVEVAYPQLYQYQSADQALRFDPKTGVFDITYAAAWQLGRLLALKDPAFFKSLSTWKSTYQKQRALKAGAAVLSEKEYGINIQTEKLSSMLHEAESDEVLTDLLIELWNQR